MALIRKKELRDMGEQELAKKTLELSVELARERGAIKATGKPTNAGKFKQMRKTIARIHTLLGERARKKAKPAEAKAAPRTAPAKPAAGKA